MASSSFAAAATRPASSPLTLDPIPLASRRPPQAARPPTRPPPAPRLPEPPSHFRRRDPGAAEEAPLLLVAEAQVADRAQRCRQERAAPPVLLYFGDLAWRWSHPAPPPAPEGFEASLARSFRMMQLQVEAVDRKIDGAVGAARGDLVALLEEKRLALEGQLSRLDEKTNELGDALAGFKRMELLGRNEFHKFCEDVKDTLRSESGSEVDLNQVRALAREIAMKEIEKHAADGVGRVDYAVASAGGRVARHSDVYDTKRGGFFAALRSGDDPQKMLQPSFGEPGQCFAMQGSTGFVEIKLKTAIIPEAVTLEHVSKVRFLDCWSHIVVFPVRVCMVNIILFFLHITQG
jgi:SUN domain-containing protein 1/2